MSFDYDLFVIGGGSGGVRAARLAAAEAGARVGLAEEYRMGGTCVIRGCVPKKLMVYASGYPRVFEEARAYGWQAQAGEFDWTVFRARLYDELTRLEGVYRGNLERAGVEIFDSRAVLADPHTVRLANGIEKTARHILIATGGRPFVPEFPGSDLAITSNDVFLFESLPKRILIVGGGYIACEFACILNGLGVEVTQFYRGAQILRGFDEEARGHIAGAMCAQGVDLRVGCNVQRIDRVEDGLWVKATDGRDAVFDAVLFATGRRPNTDGMGLEEAGVRLKQNGAVEVDAWSQSSVPSVYAVGDVTDRIALTPVAIREGAAFVETVFKANPTRADHELVPGAVFTQPEYGAVGMTEEEARSHGPIEVYSTAFRPMQSGFAGQPDRVMMKLIVETGSRKVLGCHIVADHAAEMIQLAAVAIKMGATKEDFDRTVAVHPTMAEELVTLKAPVRTG
ncbi:glutathione-disulfide reductase [Rhodovulum visakhapatnamense]|uniref:Glutathione reductase n=1 Tax=Rhodovulum visakhapatnamense TaxID=364297 RepID=A0A4R8G7G7_9RHOB|nr:glutathione-disulfide reductase [Rhodovulum visakhapatnamense]TDX31318.1 NADPH-glutathione reductase [Rhodovulum visakhapatnamense]